MKGLTGFIGTVASLQHLCVHMFNAHISVYMCIYIYMCIRGFRERKGYPKYYMIRLNPIKGTPMHACVDPITQMPTLRLEAAGEGARWYLDKITGQGAPQSLCLPRWRHRMRRRSLALALCCLALTIAEYVGGLRKSGTLIVDPQIVGFPYKKHPNNVPLRP